MSKAKGKKGGNRLKFIDLFAGIGGFHHAANSFDMKCVFVSEFDEACKKIYEQNFGIPVHGDITDIDVSGIETHDVLFAGFPCQPFSKGGYRKGFNDSRGNLFFNITNILDHHKPTYFILENVPNLVTHDKGNTYKVITETLRELGYSIPDKPLILSPHQFGVPVLRKRIYIPGVLSSKGDHSEKFTQLLTQTSELQPLSNIIDVANNRRKKYKISEYEGKVVEMWDDFYKGVDMNVIGFPIWADYFKDMSDISELPIWKQNFILKNRDLYKRNKKFIDEWLKKYEDLRWVQDTHRKFEWQAGENARDMYETLIQFRPSGVRAKVANYFSTLVAMNHNQIIGKFKRRLTPEETKKLQSFPDDFILHQDDNISFKQLGNAVNVEVVKRILGIMLK